MKMYGSKQNLLAKKIRSDFLIPFVLSIFLILGIIWLTKIISIIDIAAAKSVSALTFLTLITIIIPDLLFYIIPFSLIICFYIFFQNYFFTREIYIFRNIPIKPKILFKPLGKVIFMIVCFQFLLGFIIAPKAYQIFEKLKFDIKHNLISVALTPGSVEKIGNNMLSFVGSESENEILNNLFLYRTNQGEKEYLIANFAKIANFNSDITLKINDGLIFREDKNGGISTMKFQSFNDEISLMQNNNYSKTHYKEFSIFRIIDSVKNDEKHNANIYAGLLFKAFWIVIPFFIFILAQEIYFYGEFRRNGLGKKHLLFSAVAIFFIILSFIVKKIAAKNIPLVFFIIISAIILIYLVNKANFSEKI